MRTNGTMETEDVPDDKAEAEVRRREAQRPAGFVWTRPWPPACKACGHDRPEGPRTDVNASRMEA